MNTTAKLSFAAALSFALSACQPANGESVKSEDIKALNAKLDKLDKKLDGLAKNSGRAAAPKRKRPTVGELYKVSVSDDDLYRGGKNAKVTIVEATEFACPYCRMLAGPTEELLKHYDEEDLKVVSKQFIVHPSLATKPALAACAANKQGKFGDFEHALWSAAWKGDERPQLVREGLSDDSLNGIAKNIGLDMTRFKSDMDGSCKSVIARSKKEMSTLGVSGTPAVYINGRYYGGPRTVEGLKEAVDKEIARADATLAKGGSLDSYYSGLIAKGKAQL